MSSNGDENGNTAVEAEAPVIEETSEETAPAAPSGPPQTYDDLFPSLGGPSGQGISVKPSAGPVSAWGKKPSIAPSNVTQVLQIAMAERKGGMGGFGSGGDDARKQLNAVMDKTGAKVEMSTSRDQSLTFLITGKQDVVLRARRELLKEFQTQASFQVNIPKEHHKYILGKGGAKLQEMEAKTATKISIPKQTEESNIISISGPKEGIDQAVKEMKIISDEQSKQAYEVIQIPKNFHPFINGPNGETSAKLIANYSNVKINIPPMSVIKNEISISGEKEAVLAVAEAVRKLHKDIERKYTEVNVEVKKTQHKYIIGPKGNTINEILSETGIFVEVPNVDVNSETITLRGPQDKLGDALKKVYEKANSVVSYVVPCPSWLHKYIIGKKGAGITKLTNEHQKVHVEFMETGDKIKVEGPPDETDKVREILEAQAKDLTAKTKFVEINVEAKYHKHIIGKGGSTVNSIKQKADVNINIPDTDHGETIIRIEGNKEGVDMAKKELEQLVFKMQNEREKDLIIENRFHRQIIGPKGESIQKLRDEYPAVQISFPDLGQDSDIVKLRGPKDDVDKVTKYLTKVKKDLEESNYQEKVPIFKQFHKFIIGKGGATIKKIRTETNTKIDLPESNSESDMIAITGRKEHVKAAVKQLQAIQSEMADVVTVEISVPSKIHNTMIGSGGKLIQSVMDDCGGVSIKFPPSDAKSDKVTIRGPKDDVEKAKKILNEMANEKQLSSMTAEVKAKIEHHRFLIGRNGSNVQSLRERTGAKIIFPNEKDSDKETITILGTKEAVAAAKKELEEKIKGLDNVVEDTMNVDQKHHKHFIARRGEVLRQIGEEFGGVIVSFPRAGVDSEKVTLKGAKNCVEGARSRIQEIVLDLENQVTIECHIDQQHHRTVMGVRGSRIQKICADFNVQIKIPEKRAQNGGENGGEEVNAEANIIRISGRQENCDGAAEALQNLVPVSEEMNVAFEFHRYIIGAKGVEVRRLMDLHDVNIKVPTSDLQSDAIIITGARPNIQGAKASIAEKVVELEKEKADKEARSFEVQMEVDPEYHSKIIGKRGATITKIRMDYEVNIHLPKKGDPNEHIITITGFEADANKAKEAIAKIVNEYENMTKEEITIDRRVHSMIIGRRGQGIRKIMTDFKVDIKLPREGDPDPDLVQVLGDEEAVLDCVDHLKNLEEEYMQDVKDKEWMEAYTKPPKEEQNGNAGGKGASKGFQVKGAPWQGASDEAFPTLGNGDGPAASGTGGRVAWGPAHKR